MVQILTGPRFARALRAGALAVVREQETLNRINVFPVPDADTGANLASTLRAAAAAMALPRGIALGETLRNAADAALDGARGNSGAIFAQFLYGLAESAGNRVHMTTREFAAAARRGVDAAHEALTKPVDGTILSVLKAWGAALDEHGRNVADFGELLSRGLFHARTALANTPRQLAVLAKHGVVDAGGQGFVYFLEGISAFFGDRNAASWRRTGISLEEPTPFAAAHADVDATYRYCSEALLVGASLDRKAVAALVGPLGGSLVVAGGGSRLRIHLHTNMPQQLFALLATVGAVERTKIDDMILQQLASRQAAVGLVTDSSCDLPEARSHALGVVRVPLTVRFGEEAFLDGVDITPVQFYARLAAAAVPARTSQPAVGDYRMIFERLLESHAGVLCLCLSGALSGTYQAAVAAARLCDPDRVRVIDTGQVSIGLAVTVEAVGEAIASGADLATAASLAESTSRSARLFAAFRSLDTAARGGRVKPSLARLVRLLHLNPILTVDPATGKAEKDGLRFGFPAALHGLVSRAWRHAAGRPVRLLVGHANAVGAAEYLAERLSRRFQVTDIPVVNLAAVLAAHTGPGAVGVAVLPSSPTA
jgi:DegV family protein with EDD domain